MERKKYAGAIVVAAVLGSPPAAGRAGGAVGTVLLVVVNSGSLTAQETAKKALLEGWGYTVTPISASASQGTFDTSCLTSSCAYISCTVSSGTLDEKLTATTIPVIVELDAQAVEMGFSSSTSSFTGKAIDITNTSHYITSTFASGSLSLFSSNQALRNLSGTTGNYTALGEKPSSSSVALALFERGDDMGGSHSGEIVPGRRVYLPWSGSTVDITKLTSNGQTLLQRTVEWCLMPVAWYKLDDAAGSTVVDSAGGYNGTRSGGAWTTGKFAGGLSFNGSNDYVSINNATAFQVTSALTITGWVKATGAWGTGTDVDIVLRKGDANPNNWQLAICNGKVECLLDGNDDGGFKGNTTLSLNTWHHVAGTWDGAKVRIYVNGVLDNTPASKAAPIGTDTRAVYLGGRIGSTDVINGVEDDVRFYNRCLTAAEIAALAASGKPTIMSWENVAP